MKYEWSSLVKDSRLVSWIAQTLAVLIPVFVTLDRFRRPSGEKYMFMYQGGSMDMWVLYNGAAAILRGLNPYGPLPPELRDPMGWPIGYPPQTLVLLAPLVRWTNGSVEEGTQWFFWLNLCALVAFSLVVWRLLVAVTTEKSRINSPLLTVGIALALCPQMMYALERGQSELLNAAVSWGAILAFTRKRYAWAMGLATFAAAIKGYSIPLALGLLIAIPERKAFFRGLASAVGVSAVFTIPVLPYVMDGIKALTGRLGFFFMVEAYNHSFKAVLFYWAPEYHAGLRTALCCVTVLGMLAAGYRLNRSTRLGDQRQTAIAAVLFGGFSEALMVGIPDFSAPYCYLLFLPALLLLALAFPDFSAGTRLPRGVRLPVGWATLFCCGAALLMEWKHCKLSLAGVALIGFILCAGILVAVPRARTA